MFSQLLITIVIMTGLIAGYYLVQRGLRRVTPGIADDCDLLETRWGCGGCALVDSCDLSKEHKH